MQSYYVFMLSAKMIGLFLSDSICKQKCYCAKKHCKCLQL